MKIKIGDGGVAVADYIKHNQLLKTYFQKIADLDDKRRAISKVIRQNQVLIDSYTERLKYSNTDHDNMTVHGECGPLIKEIAELEAQSKALATVQVDKTSETINLDVIRSYINITDQTQLVIEHTDLENGQLNPTIKTAFLSQLPDMKHAIDALETTLIKINSAKATCTTEIAILQKTKSDSEEIKLLRNVQTCLNDPKKQPYQQLNGAIQLLTKAQTQTPPKWYNRLREILGVLITPPKGYTRFEAISGKQYEDAKNKAQTFKNQIEALKQEAPQPSHSVTPKPASEQPKH